MRILHEVGTPEQDKGAVKGVGAGGGGWVEKAQGRCSATPTDSAGGGKAPGNFRLTGRGMSVS